MSREAEQRIARQFYAMVTKRKEPDLLQSMRNERYQRTFTSEYLFRRTPRPRDSIPEERQEHWAAMDRLMGK